MFAAIGTRGRRGLNIPRSGQLRGGATTQRSHGWNLGLAALGHCRRFCHTRCCVTTLVAAGVVMRKRSGHDTTVVVRRIRGGQMLARPQILLAMIICLEAGARATSQGKVPQQEKRHRDIGQFLHVLTDTSFGREFQAERLFGNPHTADLGAGAGPSLPTCTM